MRGTIDKHDGPGHGNRGALAMESPLNACLSFSLLDSNLGCGPGQLAQFPADSLTRCAAQPPHGIYTLGFATSALRGDSASVLSCQWVEVSRRSAVSEKSPIFPSGGKLYGVYLRCTSRTLAPG